MTRKYADLLDNIQYKKPSVTSNSFDLKEIQTVMLKKAAAISILTEYGRYLMDRGEDKAVVWNAINDQSLKTVESVCLPVKFASSMVSSVMNKIYTKVNRGQRLREEFVSNIIEINKEDQGGQDAGMGLPDEMCKLCDKIKEFDKVIDESEDLIVEANGNKFIEMCLTEMKTHLPTGFVTIIS